MASPLETMLAGVFSPPEGGGGGGGDFDYSMLAPAFDPDNTYAVGDLVLYQDKVYEFTSPHTGMWDAADVTRTSLGAHIPVITGDSSGNISISLTEV